ncbi:MAG: prenyltransferase [Candidatus Lokiarchaeota archaeon]|nr:prenyltransferase [Candidatus Lokiarchaeota archaeon]
MTFKTKLKAYLDLTRAHFAIVWPLLFISGLLIAFRDNNYFSFPLVITVFFIGLFGFEAGMVLNDIVDRKIDKLGIDNEFTKYWRPFKERPLSADIISFREALIVFLIFVAITIVLIATLPFPNNLYLYIIMIYAYSVEIFYQKKKGHQEFPIAQLVGRTDLTLFPVAGYLCYGNFSITIVYIVLFLYPWAQAHLGLNDLGDYDNDKAKNLKTITILYGIKGNIKWIAYFTVIQIGFAIVLLFLRLGFIALIGFSLSFILLITANISLFKNQTSNTAIKMLPRYHASLLIYILSIIFSSIFPIPFY